MSGKILFIESLATGSKAFTIPPSSTITLIISMDAESLTSSVFGLKERPKIPIVLFLKSPPISFFIFFYHS